MNTRAAHPTPARRLALTGLVTLLAASCTAPAPTVVDSPVAPTATSTGPVTIVHWQHEYEARTKIVAELAREFEAANPNIHIDFQAISYNDYFQKIGPALEAGTGPDVFQIPGPQVREFYDRGQLMPVPADVYAPADLEADFVPWTVALLKQDGGYVGLPTDVQPILAFYNDALFKEAGLDPTQTLDTWEAFSAAAVTLTHHEGDALTQAGVDVAGSPYQLYWAMPMIVFDSGWVDAKTLKVSYNNAQGVAMWRWMTDLVLQQKADSAEFLTGQDKFALRKAAISFHEYAYAGVLAATAPDLKYSVHLLPHPADRPAATGGTHWSYVVSAQSAHPAEAWAWIKFLTSVDSQRKWIAGGGEMPSRTALYSDETLRADPNVAAALDSMKVVRAFNDFGWDDVYAIHQSIWDKIVLNGLDVQTAVSEAATAEEQLYADKRIKPTP